MAVGISHLERSGDSVLTAGEAVINIKAYLTPDPSSAWYVTVSFYDNLEGYIGSDGRMIYPSSTNMCCYVRFTPRIVGNHIVTATLD